MVTARDVGQIVAEPLGAVGGPARQASATPLIDLERRYSRSIECFRIVDTGIGILKNTITAKYR